MAWTAPKSWTSTMTTAVILNAQIKANFDALGGHDHSGVAGDGVSTLAGRAFSAVSANGLAVPALQNQSGSPSVAGRLQRNGTNLEYYNGTAVVGLYANGAAGIATCRSLGSGSTQAAAGDHTH